MNILNYIFYRLYVQYLKKNEDATFSGIVFIGSILLFLFLPLWGFLKYVRDEVHKITLHCREGLLRGYPEAPVCAAGNFPEEVFQYDFSHYGASCTQ
jgi:hypothetical protein